MLNDPRLPARFWAKVLADPESGCWTWAASKNGKGYGQIAWLGSPRLAHRVAYVALIGDIPSDLGLDHLCRRRDCVNPSHLEPTTQRVNNDRSPITIPTINSAKTECPRGHRLVPGNLRPTQLAAGKRACLRCHYDANNARAAARRLALEGV